MKSFIMQIILFGFLIENKVINRHNAVIQFDYLILNTTYIMLYLLLFLTLFSSARSPISKFSHQFSIRLLFNQTLWGNFFDISLHFNSKYLK